MKASSKKQTGREDWAASVGDGLGRERSWWVEEGKGNLEDARLAPTSSCYRSCHFTEHLLMQPSHQPAHKKPGMKALLSPEDTDEEMWGPGKRSRFPHTFHNKHEFQGLWVIFFKEAKELWKEERPHESPHLFCNRSGFQRAVMHPPLASKGDRLTPHC